MNQEQHVSLIEGYELPGFGILPEYKIISTVPESESKKLIDLAVNQRRINRILGESGYSYTMLPHSEAVLFVEQNNLLRSQGIAEFRHKVYGEPLPA